MHHPRRQEWYVVLGSTTWAYWVRWPAASPIPAIMSQNGRSDAFLPDSWLELGTVDLLSGPPGTPGQMREMGREVFDRWLRVVPALLIICSRRHARGYFQARRIGYRVSIIDSGLCWSLDGIRYSDDHIVLIEA